ncbi:MAG: CPBP family intramembrane metalloprotease [Cyanobacteria bacterium]|nr:CPBP family intramembrane metalloprotease [Cyanobacteriota bacterium]MDW8200532.1 CPBP family intramembrane glutamic endopeptidase [Cyanobacteriota bacterium SKYGB_h_bin112]
MDPQPDNFDLEPLDRTQMLVAIGATAVVLLLVTTLWRQFGKVALLPWHVDLSSILIGIGVGMGIIAASAIIYQVWPAYRVSTDLYLQLVLAPLLLPDMVWVGLLPGLSEELLFRGVMLPALGANMTGLILSSLCFGVLHFSSPRLWAYAIWATIVGLILGAVALWTDNLMVPIVAHITANFVSSVAWKLRSANLSAHP